MKISASIVTHNTPIDELRSVIRSLRGDSVAKIFVVDNSTEDKLRQDCEELDVEYIHVSNNGYGAGHNIAIHKALSEGFDYHLVVNADVRWKGNVVDTLCKIMEGDYKIGLTSPRVVYPDGTLQYSCRLLPTPFDVFAKRFIPKKLIIKRMQRYMLSNADHHLPFQAAYLTGCFLLFRMNALKDVGLFDERFFMYPEDIDITRRLHRNWITRYSPECEVVHLHHAASRTNFRMLRIHIVNMIRYFNKWGWWSDKERKLFNREIINQLPIAGKDAEPGRG